MIVQELMKIMLGLVVAAVLYFVTQLILRAKKILNAELEKELKRATAANQTAKAAAFQFAITILNTVTYSVVSRIEAQKAFQLRKAVKAGEAEFMELKLLSSEAYHDIMLQLSEEVKECLDNSVSDLEGFVMDKIEELLPKVKADYIKNLSLEDNNSGSENVEG